jgi:hypothetical protein
MPDTPAATPALPKSAFAGEGGDADLSVRAIIDRWFNTHIAGSPIARSADAYNHLRTVLGHLETDFVQFASKEL